MECVSKHLTLYSFKMKNKKTMRMTKASEKQIGLLYLPENVIHEIFLYLRCEELYLSIRKTCRLFSKYVDNYYQLSGVFLLVPGVMKQDRLQVGRAPCKMIYALKQNKKLLPMFWEEIPSLPKPYTQKIANDLELMSCEEIGCFGGLIKQRIVAGYFCKEHWTGSTLGGRRKSISRVSSVFNPYGSRSTNHSTYRLVPYVYEYQGYRKMWVSITAMNTRLKSLEFPNDIECHLSHCSIEDSMLVKLDISGTTYTYCTHRRRTIFDDALMLFKFEISSDNENSNELANCATLHYAVKNLIIPNKLINTMKLLRRQRSLTSFFPVHVYTVTENSRTIMILHDEHTKWKIDGDMKKLNRSYQMTPNKSAYLSTKLFKGFILQNKMYVVDTYLSCLHLLKQPVGDDNRSVFFTDHWSDEEIYDLKHFVPSTLKVQEAVSNSDESLSLILGLMASSKSVRNTTSELILISFTAGETFQPDLKRKLQGDLTHGIFHLGLYFDDPDIDHVSKSTLIRII